MRDSFFDTNVLVYLALEDGAKAERAGQLVKSGGTISVQVLNEIANVLRAKRTRSWGEVRNLLSTLQQLLTVEPITLQTHAAGLAISERYRLAIYDSMIVAAAVLSGSHTLWSEDMHDGLVVNGQLTIRNPFAQV
jgi:predicted nucleic acid-binding protein